MTSGLFQVVYTKYQTSSNKERIKKEFLFLESFHHETSMEYIQQYNTLSKRYANLNNVIILEYDNTEKGFIFYDKGRKYARILEELKGQLQEGEKIHIQLDVDS